MADSCTSVGPAVYGPPLRDEERAHRPADSLTILSWNVHVGGGDIVELVDDLRAGRLTDGAPVQDFVVLLQEAFRGGVTVPNVRWRSFPIPRRIEESPPGRVRQDIVQVANALGLGIFYLPSMRNGAAEGSHAEDRGNAILSTRALSDLAGIELPFERQRRVAASATVTGVDTAGRRWQLRLVTAHLNATASIRRLWVFAAGARARQAGHLARVLGSNPVPTVIGSDLNSWAGGASEPAFKTLRAHFPQTPDPGGEPTFRRGKRLDYIFLRVPSAWLGRFTTIEGFFGSDHRPLLARIEFASAPAPASAMSAYPKGFANSTDVVGRSWDRPSASFDGVGPDLEVRARHGAVRRQPSVRIAEFLEIVAKLLAREQRAKTDVVRGLVPLVRETLHEHIDYRRRDTVAPVGVHESKKYQMAEKDRPVVAKTSEQSRPVEILPSLPQQVQNVGAVEPLAFLDERLRPDHLFGWAQPESHAEHLALRRMQEPLVIDYRDTVARGVHNVHVVRAAVDLGQPVGIWMLRPIPRVLEHTEGSRAIGLTHEDVQVLRVAVDRRVARIGVRASYEEGNVASRKKAERIGVKGRRRIPAAGRVVDVYGHVSA
jgi:endonuclease/exonuclease/phosphatase family metal-dependent hydrolase